jgi:hypothetical protein
MKTQIGLIVIGLLLFTNGFSQTDNVLYQEIDSIVNSINRMSSSCVRTKTHEGSNGQDSWFREIFQNSNDEIILLTLNNKDTKGYQFVEYYYSGRQVIFIKQTQTDKNENKNTEQFYLYNGQLLRWIEPNGVFKNENSDSFKKISLELADYATSLASDFKKQ